MVDTLSFCRICLLLCLFCVNPARADDSSPRVVASIAPLQALVAGVMQGVAEPGLLLDITQSPHHATLRPSQMRSLGQAELVFWIGPQLESFLPRLLHGLHSSTRTVAMLDNPQLHTLPLRQPGDHGQVTNAGAIDPHIWLSTDNAAVMVSEVAARLIALDPVHTSEYRHNEQRMRADISALHSQLAALAFSNRRYIAYHDGYQYFEQEFALQLAASVSQHDELQPSAGYVRELRHVIQQQDIRCLVYDAPLRPALIDTLLHASHARAVELDPLGLRQPGAQGNWFTLMRQLASSFSQCLAAQSRQN